MFTHYIILFIFSLSISFTAWFYFVCVWQLFSPVIIADIRHSVFPLCGWIPSKNKHRSKIVISPNGRQNYSNCEWQWFWYKSCSWHKYFKIIICGQLVSARIFWKSSFHCSFPSCKESRKLKPHETTFQQKKMYLPLASGTNNWKVYIYPHHQEKL